MGVNKLADNWISLERGDGSEWFDAMRIAEASVLLCGCASDLEQVARTAWHPVSEPPRKEDGYYVIVVGCLGEVRTTPWHAISVNDQAWARIRDVVLLPPEDD
jgi:hypothetical protein